MLNEINAHMLRIRINAFNESISQKLWDTHKHSCVCVFLVLLALFSTIKLFPYRDVKVFAGSNKFYWFEISETSSLLNMVFKHSISDVYGSIHCTYTLSDLSIFMILWAKWICKTYSVSLIKTRKVPNR